MKPFIFTERRNAIYIIDLGETVRQLMDATEFLSGVSAKNGKILSSPAREAGPGSGPRGKLKPAASSTVNHRWPRWYAEPVFPRSAEAWPP